MQPAKPALASALDMKWHTLAVGSGAWLLQALIVCWAQASKIRNLQPARSNLHLYLQPANLRNPSGTEALKETPAGAGCRGTGPPGASISARPFGALCFGTEASADPGHWALGLVIPAGAGCRSTGPPGANSTERVW